jgi:hypothetical protein
VTFLQIKRLTGKQAAIAPGLGSTVAAGVADRSGRRADAAGADGGRNGARRGGGASGVSGGRGPGGGGEAEWLAGVGVPGEPPTVPLPVVGAAPGAGAGFGWTGAMTAGGPALPDVSEVLDDAFGARRD